MLVFHFRVSQRNTFTVHTTIAERSFRYCGMDCIYDHNVGFPHPGIPTKHIYMYDLNVDFPLPGIPTNHIYIRS